MTREEFKQALSETASNEFSDILNDTSEHVFSENFERKMNKLIKATNKKSSSSLKVFCKWASVIAASVLLTATTTVHIMSKYIPETASNPQATMNISQYSGYSKKYTEITFEDCSCEYITDNYDFEYLPTDYQWSRTELTRTSVKTEYVFLKKTIYFTQRPAVGRMTYTDFTSRPFTVDGIDAIMFESSGSYNIVWTRDTYVFVLDIPKSVPESEIIKMMESFIKIE